MQNKMPSFFGLHSNLRIKYPIEYLPVSKHKTA